MVKMGSCLPRQEAIINLPESQRLMDPEGGFFRRLRFRQVGGVEMSPMGETDTSVTCIPVSHLFASSGEYVSMSPKIFSALSMGKKDWLEIKRMEESSTPMERLKSYGGDSVLHVAAGYNHLKIVKKIVEDCPSLLLEPNSRDQLPLHVAAHAGHLAVVDALVSTLKTVSPGSSEETRECPNLYVMKDKNGDTPLHLAVKGSHENIVHSLLDADKQALFIDNNEGNSPLYLAVEAGFESYVKKMFDGVIIPPNGGSKTAYLESHLKGRPYLTHAALKSKKKEILDVILKEYPRDNKLDEKGMTCLSFGVSIGFYDGVWKLLDQSTESVYKCNEDGSFPIHIAVEKRYSRICREILKRCPDSLYLLNKKGQSIFHIAAEMGQATSCFPRHLWKEYLTEKQDVDGNTPLHLATKNWHPCFLLYLSWFGTGKSKYTRNNDGLRALDIAESTMQSNYIFRERMTLIVLLDFYSRSLVLKPRKLFKMVKNPLSSYPPAGDKSKAYINILLVVAALVAAVTFAAGFTVPGGFNSSGPKSGRVTLDSDTKLIKFMIFDILAMQSSVVTICILIWAQLGDPAFIHLSLKMALPALFFSLICMSAAFYCGVLVAFAHVKGMVIFVNVAAAIFFFIMLVLLGPHVSLNVPGSSLLLGPYLMLFSKILYQGTHE